MTQVLHLTNGKTIQEKLEAKDNRITKFLDAKIPDAEIIETIFLSTLSRYPTDSEKQRLATLLSETPEGEKRQSLEDLFWSVFTSKEFLFQH